MRNIDIEKWTATPEWQAVEALPEYANWKKVSALVSFAVLAAQEPLESANKALRATPQYQAYLHNVLKPAGHYTDEKAA